MATSITTSFVEEYMTDLHHVFQREGSMLKDTVFLKDGVVGSTAHFQKLGTGTATTKSRHGEITPYRVIPSAKSDDVSRAIERECSIANWVNCWEA